MNRFLTNGLLCALLTGIAALFISAQATPHATVDDKSAEEVRRLNAEEVESFLYQDPKAMTRLWSDDFVVTNLLDKIVNKQQVLGMVESGFLVMGEFSR
jgi:hypothetical protein